MDSYLKPTQYISACLKWRDGHLDEAAGFEFLKATETSLNLRANGMLFQLLLPLADDPSEENFIVMNLDSSAPDILVMALNEKLERVHVGPFALEQALDVFSKALSSFQEKRWSADTTSLELRRNIPHGIPACIEMSNDQNKAAMDVIDLSDHECDGYDSESEGCGDSRNCESEDGEMEYDDEHFTPGDFENDDIQFAFQQFQDHNVRKRPGDGAGRTGFLYVAAQEASNRCETARRRSVNSFLPNPAKPKLSGSSALAYMDDILQFCNIATVPNLSWIQIQAEVTGMVNDVRLAAALGLSFGKTLNMFLDFDQMFWSERSLRKPLEVNRITVKLMESSRTETDVTAAEGSNFGKTESDGEFDAEYRKFPGQQKALGYGTTALLPELIRTFFKRHNGESILNLRPKPWKNEGLDEALNYFVAVENPFVGLICFIGTQLRALPSWCPICWSLLPASVTRLRTCQDDLCLYEFEELGLGAAIHHEIQESPEVVEFELSLACAAADINRDVFEPFPAFLLTKDEVRGRSGWFSKPSEQVAIINSTNRVVRVQNKKLALLLEILQTIPRIAELKECIDESSLKRMLSKAAFVLRRNKRLESTDMWCSYDLMRFILSTNRLSLRLLKEEEKLPTCNKALYQFVVLHDSPEKEAVFEGHRSERGSFFAFHGSGPSNWYSILRNGLRCMSGTQYMSTGATYGKGVYLADDFSISYNYARSLGGTSYRTWKNASLLKDGMAIMAVCEVVTGSADTREGPTPQNNGIYVVPPGNQDDISVRYLIVMDPYPGTAASGIGGSMTIKGSALEVKSQGYNGQSIDLCTHYEQLRLGEQLQQHRRLLDLRLEAFQKLKEEVGKLYIDVEKQSNNTPPSVFMNASCSASSRHGEKKYAGQHQPLMDGMVHDSKRLKDNCSAATVISRMPATATQAITREHRNIQKEICKARTGSCHSDCADSFLAHITVDIPNESNMYVWHVSLHQNLFRSYPELYNDLEDLAAFKQEPAAYVLLETTFTGMYPFQPPFVRVVRPRFLFHTGHVTVGGSICMELLTNSGWLPSFSFENVLVQIVNAFGEGRGRVDKGAMGQEYSMREAREAFTRVAGYHGWKVGTNNT